MKYFIKKCQPLSLLFLLIVFAPSSIAQKKEVNNQVQTWVSINSTVRVTPKFGFIADAHMRRNNFLSDPSFYFVRVALNYWLRENVTMALGYGEMWVAPSKGGHHFAKEDRIYQQAQMSSKVGKVEVLQRLRNEQRWQEKIVNDKFINSYKFTDRIRYLLSFNIPFSPNRHYPSLVISDELLVQFGKEVIYNTFDQNRVFTGIKQRVSKSLSFDLGYMVVYQQKTSGYQFDRNETWRWFFYYTPDFRKK